MCAVVPPAGLLTPVRPSTLSAALPRMATWRSSAVPGGPATVDGPAARGHRHRDRAHRHRHRPGVPRPRHASAAFGAAGRAPRRGSDGAPVPRSGRIALVAPGRVSSSSARTASSGSLHRCAVGSHAGRRRSAPSMGSPTTSSSRRASRFRTGEAVAELVIGPFGGAVIRELPPAAVTRIREGHWELRTRRGWVSIENPLDRAARDAERVRRWLGHDDADFVIKMYAAVVGPAPTVPRTTALCGAGHDQLVALARRAAATAQLDRGASAAGRRDGSRRPPADSARAGGWLVGEPGLEPGTSGI